MTPIPDMYQAILAKLQTEQARVRALEEEMNQPETAARPARLVELAKEHGKLRRQLEAYNAFTAAQKAYEETSALAAGDDADMRELAHAELPTLLTQRDATLEQIVST